MHTHKIALLELLQYLKDQKYQFTTITPKSHQIILDRSSNETAVDLEDIFGWSMPFAKERLDENIFNLLSRNNFIYLEQSRWRSSIRVSSLQEMLFIHSAYPTDHPDSVFFGPDTYRFIHAMNQHLLFNSPTIYRAVELCCGASPAALALAQACASPTEIFAIDINPQALFYSRVNAEAAGHKNINAIQSDLFKNLEGKFDFIVANPPFLIDDSERAYRHGGGEMGAELSLKILEASLNYLAPQGTIFLYTGVAMFKKQNLFLNAIRKHLLQYPAYQWTYQEIDPDIFGEELEKVTYRKVERIAAVVVTIKNTTLA